MAAPRHDRKPFEIVLGFVPLARREADVLRPRDARGRYFDAARISPRASPSAWLGCTGLDRVSGLVVETAGRVGGSGNPIGNQFLQIRQIGPVVPACSVD